MHAYKIYTVYITYIYYICIYIYTYIYIYITHIHNIYNIYIIYRNKGARRVSYQLFSHFLFSLSCFLFFFSVALGASAVTGPAFSCFFFHELFLFFFSGSWSVSCDWPSYGHLAGPTSGSLVSSSLD